MTWSAGASAKADRVRGKNRAQLVRLPLTRKILRIFRPPHEGEVISITSPSASLARAHSAKDFRQRWQCVRALAQLCLELLELHDVLDAAVEEVVRGFVVRAVIAEPAQQSGGK